MLSKVKGHHRGLSLSLPLCRQVRNPEVDHQVVNNLLEDLAQLHQAQEFDRLLEMGSSPRGSSFGKVDATIAMEITKGLIALNSRRSRLRTMESFPMDTKVFGKSPMRNGETIKGQR